MPEPERYDAVIIGSGEGGKSLPPGTWHRPVSGLWGSLFFGSAVLPHTMIPSKNEIWSAGVAKVCRARRRVRRH